MFLCIPTAATVSPALCLSCNWSDQWHLTSSPSTHHTQYTRQRNTSSYTQRTKSSTQMGSATAGNMCMYVKQQNSTRFAFVLMFCMAAAFFFLFVCVCACAYVCVCAGHGNRLLCLTWTMILVRSNWCAITHGCMQVVEYDFENSRVPLTVVPSFILLSFLFLS